MKRHSFSHGDMDAWQQSYEESGYLYLSSLLDGDQVWDIREAYLKDFRETLGEAYGVPGHAAYQWVRRPDFQSFCENPQLKKVATRLLGGGVDLLTRKILRTFTSGSQRASKAHFDQSYFPEGSDQIVTAWIPLGDCSVEQGGILYLEGSQHEVQKRKPFPKKWITENLRGLAQEWGGQWLTADFQAGDVVFHSPYIVHGTLDCISLEPRVSTDIRFVRTHAEKDWRWSQDWRADDGF